MRSVRTPQKKKELSYKRDHYAKNKYDKGRTGWRIKKKKARRSYRHAADSLAKAAAFDGESDAKISAVEQRRIQRWGVPCLRELVTHKLTRRANTVGAKKGRRARRETILAASVDQGATHLISKMVQKALPADATASHNLKSWQQIRERIAKYSDDQTRSKWKSMARHVVSELQARGLALHFRIGMGMHHIILSTAERHGLKTEPRVTLEFHPKDRLVRVAYGRTILLAADSWQEEGVSLSAAVQTVLRYLRRLRTETKPEAPLPEALLQAEE